MPDPVHTAAIHRIDEHTIAVDGCDDLTLLGDYVTKAQYDIVFAESTKLEHQVEHAADRLDAQRAQNEALTDRNHAMMGHARDALGIVNRRPTAPWLEQVAALLTRIVKGR